MDNSGRSLISLEDFDSNDILELLRQAAMFEAESYRNTLEGKIVATLFFEPGDGLVLRHPHGTFAANYLRALLLMFLRLALFAAILVFWTAALSAGRVWRTALAFGAVVALGLATILTPWLLRNLPPVDVASLSTLSTRTSITLPTNISWRSADISSWSTISFLSRFCLTLSETRPSIFSASVPSSG